MEVALRINLYRAQTGSETGTDIKTGEEIDTDKETDEETDEEKSVRNKILAEIKRNPMITQKQIAEKVGLSYSGIRYIMKQLQNEGVLKRTGSTKKGQWMIQDN